jgi:hypothetical protein
MYDDVKHLAVFAFTSLTTQYNWELYSRQNVEKFILEKKIFKAKHQYLATIILRCLDEKMRRRMRIEEVLQ